MHIHKIRTFVVMSVLAACGSSEASHPKHTTTDASAPAAHEDGGPVATPDGGHDRPADAGSDAHIQPADGGTECHRTEDCDDHDPCNGSETCKQGMCAGGESPCSNPDEAHCQVTCTTEHGSAACAVSARDMDRDGFAAAACLSASPKGNDCDDENAASHPGADEVCDGLDNDCNGQVDIQDGLALTGENISFGPGKLPAVIWNGNAFAVAYVQDESVWLRQLDEHGKELHAAQQINADVDLGAATNPSVAWDGKKFGVSWGRMQQLGFRFADADGVATGDFIDVAPEGYGMFGRTSVAALAQQGFVFAFECCMSRPSVQARTISPTGVVAEGLFPISNNASAVLTDLAVSGDELAIAWWRFYEPSHSYFSEWTRRSFDLTPVGDAVNQLDTQPTPGLANAPAIAASSDGWAVVYRDKLAVDATAHLLFAEVDDKGNTLCGPVDLSVHDPAGSAPFVPSKLVATEQGFIVAGSGDDYNHPTVELLEVRKGCTYRQRAVVARPSNLPFVTLARADSGELLVLWTEDYAGPIQQRTVAPQLCQ